MGLSLSGAVILTLLRLMPEVADHVILSGSSGRLPQWLVTMSMPLFPVLRFIKPDTLVRSSLRQQGVPECYYDLLYDDILTGSSTRFLRQVYDGLTRLELPQEIASPLLVCVGEKEPGYEFLEGARQGVMTAHLCGRNSVQVRAGHGQTLNLHELTERLNKVGQATFNEYLVQFSVDHYQMTIFPDARAIVKGTEDETVAKNLYAKDIGM